MRDAEAGEELQFRPLPQNDVGGTTNAADQLWVVRRNSFVCESGRGCKIQEGGSGEFDTLVECLDSCHQISEWIQRRPTIGKPEANRMDMRHKPLTMDLAIGQGSIGCIRGDEGDPPGPGTRNQMHARRLCAASKGCNAFFRPAHEGSPRTCFKQKGACALYHGDGLQETDDNSVSVAKPLAQCG